LPVYRIDAFDPIQIFDVLGSADEEAISAIQAVVKSVAGEMTQHLACLTADRKILQHLRADIGFGHAETLLALAPGKLVEMRHGGAVGHTATDDLDQLVVIELALAQIGGLARRLRVAGAIAGPAVAKPTGHLILVEPLTQSDIAGGGFCAEAAGASASPAASATTPGMNRITYSSGPLS
jgi:hypothetical protein